MVGKRKLANRETVAQVGETQIAYENERTKTLEHNRQRMLELGILDLSKSLSSAFKSNVKAAVTAKRKLNHNGFPTPAGVIRRSSRLQHVAPVSYNESQRDKDTSLDGKSGRLSNAGVRTKPEIYTEDHEKLLGSCEKLWELFTDGCDANGSRIYDPVNGKTCHQCRLGSTEHFLGPSGYLLSPMPFTRHAKTSLQKTLGHRTWCSSCNALQGQFCGDCLYMRYGENVLEVNENKDWICPVCRQICNCSLCRPKRGWSPTGALYRKVIALGYKSVAHYLILTRQGNPEP